MTLTLFAVSALADQTQSVTSKYGPSTTLTPAQIDSYISQLGSKQFQKRREALSVLEQLGPIALPQLRMALEKATDAEVRRHLSALIPSLEQAKVLTPTQLTLIAKDRPLKDFLKEVEKQSGYKVELVAGNVKDEKLPITVDWNKVSFWEAMQTLAERYGLVFQEGWYGNDNLTIRMMQGEPTAGYVQLDGPFRVSATGFFYTRNIQFNNRAGQAGSNGMNESLQANFTVSVEPKMPLLSVRAPVFTEATDDLGQSLLLPINPQRNVFYQGYRSYMHQVTGQLRPGSNGRKLRTLKGTVPVTVVAQTKPLITIEKLAEARKKTFKQGNTTIHIDDLTQNNGQPGIKMSVSENNSGGQNDYTWVNSVQQRIEVFDDKGNKLQSYGGSWSTNGNNSINGTFTYSGTPVKLVYYEWQTLSYQVPFSFVDLPLP